MKRSEYVQFMESSGFTRLEAEKMAGYALLDFSSFDAAYEYYFHSEKFWRGMVYEGHRKARRVFFRSRSKRDRASYKTRFVSPIQIPT